MTDAIIQVQDFRKTYGSFVAVDGISFDVQRGEIFGLLGPNGAGKTSTLESLEGLRRPDGGSLRVAGVDPARQARQLRAADRRTAADLGPAGQLPRRRSDALLLRLSRRRRPRRLDRARRAERQAGNPVPPALGRAAAPAGAGAGRGAQSAGGLPRRADRRIGRRLASDAARPDARAAGRRHDHPAGDARYGRSVRDGDAGRHPAQGKDRRHRHAAGADRHRRRADEDLGVHRGRLPGQARGRLPGRPADAAAGRTTSSTSAPTSARRSRR